MRTKTDRVRITHHVTQHAIDQYIARIEKVSDTVAYERLSYLAGLYYPRPSDGENSSFIPWADNRCVRLAFIGNTLMTVYLLDESDKGEETVPDAQLVTLPTHVLSGKNVPGDSPQLAHLYRQGRTALTIIDDKSIWYLTAKATRALGFPRTVSIYREGNYLYIGKGNAVKARYENESTNRGGAKLIVPKDLSRAMLVSVPDLDKTLSYELFFESDNERLRTDLFAPAAVRTSAKSTYNSKTGAYQNKSNIVHTEPTAQPIQPQPVAVPPSVAPAPPAIPTAVPTSSMITMLLEQVYAMVKDPTSLLLPSDELKKIEASWLKLAVKMDSWEKAVRTMAAYREEETTTTE